MQQHENRWGVAKIVCRKDEITSVSTSIGKGNLLPSRSPPLLDSSRGSEKNNSKQLESSQLFPLHNQIQLQPSSTTKPSRYLLPPPNHSLEDLTPKRVPTELPTSKPRWPQVTKGDVRFQRGIDQPSMDMRLRTNPLGGCTLVSHHHPSDSRVSLHLQMGQHSPFRPITPEVASSSLVGPATSSHGRPFRAAVYFAPAANLRAPATTERRDNPG